MVGWGRVNSHFCVQPDYSVEVVLWLCCAVVGVVTIYFGGRMVAHVYQIQFKEVEIKLYLFLWLPIIFNFNYIM